MIQCAKRKIEVSRYFKILRLLHTITIRVKLSTLLTPSLFIERVSGFIHLPYRFLTSDQITKVDRPVVWQSKGKDCVIELCMIHKLWTIFLIYTPSFLFINIVYLAIQLFSLTFLHRCTTDVGLTLLSAYKSFLTYPWTVVVFS